MGPRWRRDPYHSTELRHWRELDRWRAGVQHTIQRAVVNSGFIDGGHRLERREVQNRFAALKVEAQLPDGHERPPMVRRDPVRDHALEGSQRRVADVVLPAVV